MRFQADHREPKNARHDQDVARASLTPARGARPPSLLTLPKKLLSRDLANLGQRIQRGEKLNKFERVMLQSMAGLAVKKRECVALKEVRECWTKNVGKAKDLMRNKFEMELPPILSRLDATAIQEESRTAIDEVLTILHTDGGGVS